MCEAFDGGAYEIPTDDDTKNYIGQFCTIFRDQQIKKMKGWYKNYTVGLMIELIHRTPIEEYKEECMKAIQQVRELMERTGSTNKKIGHVKRSIPTTSGHDVVVQYVD